MVQVAFGGLRLPGNPSFAARASGGPPPRSGHKGTQRDTTPPRLREIFRDPTHLQLRTIPDDLIEEDQLQAPRRQVPHNRSGADVRHAKSETEECSLWRHPETLIDDVFSKQAEKCT